MKLFSSKNRTDISPKSTRESIYAFYNRSANKNVEIVRNLLESWFDKIDSEKDKKDLKERLKGDFHPTFYELFIHEFFYSSGYKLQAHPELPDTNNKPEFLCKSEEAEFYVEAKTVKNKSEEREACENIRMDIYEIINRVKSPNFFLYLENMEIKQSQSPSLKPFKSWIGRKLEKYDPDQVVINSQGYFDAIPYETFENDQLKIKVGFQPKSPALRGKEGVRPIGLYPLESKFGGPHRSIKDKILDKSGRYGNPDKPFILAVNSIDEFGTNFLDFERAIYGSTVTNLDKPDEISHRKKDGVLFGPEGKRCSRISAFFCTSVYSTSIHLSNYRIYLNPHAQIPIDFPHLITYSYEEGNLIKSDGKKLQEVVAVPNPWLS